MHPAGTLAIPINLSHSRALAITALLICQLALFSTAAEARDFTARGEAPTHEEMIARGDAGLPDLAFVRPVLTGVLYRAGFKGGDRARMGLSHDQRMALCGAGFSGARYVDFGAKTTFGPTACAGNELDYEKASSGDTRELMKDIHEVIVKPDAGPILIHCMWGVHSSGAVAALALVQFCGWSNERAKSYWHEARNNAPCGGKGCDPWIDEKFARFKIDENLEISDEQRQSVCPKP